jgi:hypothetical protein
MTVSAVMSWRGLLTATAALALALLGPMGAGVAGARTAGDLSPNVSVFATGLNGPRGLEFGPDGSLYVAEAGTGGSTSTEGQCEQVVPPVGPYLGGNTGRISKISSAGQRSTVVDGLPSNQTSEVIGADKSGVADVEFLNGTLYALLTASGCSHGNAGTSNGVIKVNADGTWSMVADLTAFVRANPVAHPSPPDFEPDGDFYSMLHVGNDLYVVESNHGELDKVTTGGQVSRVVDVSASQSHTVPTAMTYHDGAFYVGTLLPFPPTTTGQAKILKITPDGQLSVFATGLTTVLGVAFDAQGRLYALESISVAGEMPTPGTGRVVRMTGSGEWEEVASGLTFPTAMTFGPDGQLYVSDFGFGPPGGRIVRVALAAAPPPAAATPTAQPAQPTAAPAAPPRPAGQAPAAQAPAAQVPAKLPTTGDGSALPLPLDSSLDAASARR